MAGWLGASPPRAYRFYISSTEYEYGYDSIVVRSEIVNAPTVYDPLVGTLPFLGGWG